MTTELTPEQHEINRWIMKLDETHRSYEAKWGFDRLPLLVSATTAAKWDRQLARLDAAIAANDLPLVRDLAQGAIRGYAVLEAEAIAAGHGRAVIETWDATSPETGNRYRICKNTPDALGAAQEGVAVYSLAEISRILDARDLSRLHPPKAAVNLNPPKAEPFDFRKGDDLLF